MRLILKENGLAHPAEIKKGTRLILPHIPTGSRMYTVRGAETLSDIAKNFGISENALLQANPYVLGYHDLMVHDYGPGRQYASLHVEMDYREDPLTCHERIDDMEFECLRSHGIHLVIHYDPVITDDPELTRLKECCAMLLRSRDPRLQLHDFRMVPGRSHMNLVFDVELPWDLRGQEEDIRLGIQEFLNRETNRSYHIRITFDTAQMP